MAAAATGWREYISNFQPKKDDVRDMDSLTKSLKQSGFKYKLKTLAKAAKRKNARRIMDIVRCRANEENAKFEDTFIALMSKYKYFTF